MEKKTVTMECQVSKPDKKVTWYKEGQPITADENTEIIVDGCTHKLILHNTKMDDQAEYTAKVNGENTTAMLYVEGYCC